MGLIDYDARIADIHKDRQAVINLIYNVLGKSDRQMAFRLGIEIEQWAQAKILEHKRFQLLEKEREAQYGNRQQSQL